MTWRLVVAVAAGLVACGGGAVPTAPPAAVARVGLLEWEIATSAASLATGPVTLTVTNAGSSAHDLKVASGSDEWATPVLEPAQRTTLTLHLSPGERVVLWCALPGHRQQGMERTLPAAAAALTAPAVGS